MTRKMWTIPALIVLLGLGAIIGIRLLASGEPSSKPAREDHSAIPVEVVKPERKIIQHSLVIPGSFSAFEEATLFAKVAGYLRSISVDIGDPVHQGQVVAVLDVPEMSAEYQSAKAELLKARAALKKAESEVARNKSDLQLKQVTFERLSEAHKMQPGAIAPQELDTLRAQSDMAGAAVKVAEDEVQVGKAQVEAAQANADRIAKMMEYARIVAPFSGVITRRYVHPGALVPQGASGSQSQPVVTVARIDVLRFFCEIPEREVPLVTLGTRAAIRLDSLPKQIIVGKITRSSGSLNPNSRTMLVETDLPNPHGILKPGMYGNAELTLQSRPDALVIPAAAVLVESGKTYVLRVVRGKVEKVNFRSGADNGAEIEVLDALQQSDSIIVGGKNLVRPGDAVVPRLKGAGAKS
ncbi:MAG TPA: efflux RND transporter periplasmic adaptor subunit [Acidobacteriota bacterium]